MYDTSAPDVNQLPTLCYTRTKAEMSSVGYESGMIEAGSREREDDERVGQRGERAASGVTKASAVLINKE